MAIIATVATALSARAEQAEVYATYSTYGAADQAQIELTLDAAGFAMQGWSLQTDHLTLPVSAGGDDVLTFTTLDGQLLGMNGEPRILGVIEMIGSEDQSVTVSDFTLPISGRRDVPFMDGQHPVFEIIGDSLTVDVTGAHVEMHGSIRMHPAASELGLDPQVGIVGEFTLTSPVDVTDVDRTVRPEPAAGPGGGPAELPGADVTVGSLPTAHHWTVAGPVDGFRAYSVATTSCNVGTQPLDWFVGPNPRHPVISQNMYRLVDGRFEQIGQSWLKHGFCALQQNVCQTCSPVCGGCCAQLGVGCSDPYSATRNGEFTNMGPKHEINAHRGTNLGTHVAPSGEPMLRGRLVVRQSDLEQAQNPGALYYVEGHYVAEDDAQFGDLTNDNNNASYRRVAINSTTFGMLLLGGTVRETAAINVWKTSDPAVEVVNADVPGEGRFTLASNVTDNKDGTWHYEYALYNMNSDRSGRSFSVPVPPGVTLTNVGFHDVDYHSGDPYALTDWTMTEGAGAVSWGSESFAENENANALRWGTLYNYRFDADSGPEAGEVTIGLFKPGSPSSITASARVPSGIGPVIVHGAVGVPFAEHAYGGYIDPRAESTDGLNLDLGIDTLTLVFSEQVFSIGGGPLSAADFSIAETSGGSAPSVIAVDASANPTVVLTLNRIITIQEWTTIRADVENATGAVIPSLGDQGPSVDEPDRIDVGYLPGDVDQSSAVTPFDLLLYRQIVNDLAVPDIGSDVDYVDTDRTGAISPFDLLAFRQLINGVSPPATQSWNGASMNNLRP